MPEGTKSPCRECGCAKIPKCRAKCPLLTVFYNESLKNPIIMSVTDPSGDGYRIIIYKGD